VSSVVKTLTPFLNRELLLQALDAACCKYTEHGNDILTDRVDFRGNQKFVLENGRYRFWHDSHERLTNWSAFDARAYKPVSSFLGEVERQYNEMYRRKLEELEKQRLEEERLRLERERQEFVEKQRAAVIARAKEKGYAVREEKAKGKIKLVLVRTTY